ncbi:hypothetical protein D5S17_17585 [Pseudonocardiaceae bacterium YIM PH 21723]|nr:hypothetical protein D5S17_17585 [Pseudonocardiaceae bacterium YIM PH 21723]
MTSRVLASATVVWQWVTTPEGINSELMPVLRMTMPAPMRGRTIDQMGAETHVGRSYFLLLGFLPFGYDDITLAEIGPGTRFLETSTVMSMRTWRHERTITPDGDACEVHDQVTFEPRLRLPGGEFLIAAALRALFRHRHRRLFRRFA